MNKDSEALGGLKIEGKAKEEEIRHEDLSRTLHNLLQINPKILNSSRGQNIVVFVGETGAGKTTLANFLSQKGLEVNKDGEIVLANPNDPSAMQIGVSKESQTRFPQSVKIDDLLVYDLNGLDDSGGTHYELLAASLIQHIIVNAKTVRLVVVAGLDEITGAKGQVFKNLVHRIKRLLPPDVDLGKCSSCVVTKSDRPADKLLEYLFLKVGQENFRPWIESDNPRIAQMSKPSEGKINLNERESILRCIRGAEPTAIKMINPKVLFSYEVSSILKQVVEKEMMISLHRLVERIDKDISAAADRKSLEEIDLQPFISQLESEIASSELITLLKPFGGQDDCSQIFSSLPIQVHTERLQAKVKSKLGQIRAEEERLRAEQEAKARAEAEEKARVQAALKAEAERKAQVEAALRAQAEAKAREEAAIRAQAEAKAREEAAIRAQAEQARAQAEAKAREETAIRVQAEQARAQAEQARLQAEQARLQAEQALAAAAKGRRKHRLFGVKAFTIKF